MLRAVLQRTGISKLTKPSFLTYCSIAKDDNSPEIELAQLKNSWKTIVTPDLLTYTRSIDTDGIGTEWYNKVLQHAVGVGEPTVGFMTTYAFKLLANQPRPEDIKQAQILGWCAEMVHDDICDQGKIRRGLPAWYTLEDVGPAAICDGLLISQGCYHLLRKYFREKSYYPELLSNFHSTELHTAFSVSLELRIQKRNVLTFTGENLNTIIQRKVQVAFLPFACNLHLNGCTDPAIFRKVYDLAMMFGFLYQVQDDFIDVYGDPLVTGKVGSDIQTNKCTWFSVNANRLASEHQKKILGECYGSQDPEKVKQVKQLFDDLHLLERYKEHEENTSQALLKAIRSSSLGRMEAAMSGVVNYFNHRVK